MIALAWAYSEAGPLPRTAEQFRDELHTLLQHAAHSRPYVLVGLRWAGAPVRVFAHTYAADRRGRVLIESMTRARLGNPRPPRTATPPKRGRVSIITIPHESAHASGAIGLVRL